MIVGNVEKYAARIGNGNRRSSRRGKRQSEVQSESFDAILAATDLSLTVLPPGALEGSSAVLWSHFRAAFTSFSEMPSKSLISDAA